MIRNTMFALSLLALTGTSAFAASKVVATHHATRTVAADEAAPAGDKPAPEKKAKKAKKEKAPKAEKGADKGAEKAPETK
ncbi:MAG TPA: hypothetical protein VHL80_00440 [Polyangia bacterium]|nr:hypothetical protein [Polyangia bacterium]